MPVFRKGGNVDNENVHCEVGTHDMAALLSSCIMDHVQVRMPIDLWCYGSESLRLC
jgi:hypothetical protein